MNRLKSLDGEQQEIASRLTDGLGEPETISFPPQYVHHKLCYLKFTDKNRISAAVNRGERNRNKMKRKKVMGQFVKGQGDHRRELIVKPRTTTSAGSSTNVSQVWQCQGIW